MKIRWGFVSNSSSEAFICNTDKSIEQITKELGHLLEVYNEMTNSHESFGKVFELPFIGNDSNTKDIRDYLSVYKKDPSFFVTFHGSAWKNPIGKVIICSTGDNSIPYELFDLIESTYDATRIHLG